MQLLEVQKKSPKLKKHLRTLSLKYANISATMTITKTESVTSRKKQKINQKPSKSVASPKTSTESLSTSPVKAELPKPTSPKTNPVKNAISEQYNEFVLRELQKHHGEEKARMIFTSIYPALKAGLDSEFEKTLDQEQLKKPLVDLAKNVIQEYMMSHQLDEITAKLMQGELALSRTVILKAYPNLEEEQTPAQRQRFETLLSRVWIEKALNNISKYQGLPFERAVFKKLGYNIENYDNKDLLKSALRASFLVETLPSLEEMPKAFQKQAFDLRAKTADVPQEALSDFRLLLRTLNEQHQNAIKEAKKTRDELKVTCTSPSSVAFIRRHFYQQNIKKINEHFFAFLEKNKAAIITKISTPAFQPFINSLSSLFEDLKISKTVEGTLRDAEAWFKKYEGMVVAEFSQGENDADEALSEGVCLALSYRMASTALETPKASTVQIAVRSIEPSDRVVQGFHNNSVGIQQLPPKVLAGKGQQEKVLFAAEGAKNVRKGLIENLQKLKESNGGLILGWDDHATFMRFDPISDMFFFFDPNFNTIVFSKKNEETLSQLAARMADCYVELYNWTYPTTHKIMTAHQIVPLKAGEAMPTRKIDLKLKSPFLYGLI